MPRNIHDRQRSLSHLVPYGVDRWNQNRKFFITVCTRDRADEPLIQGNIPDALLKSIQFYNRAEKWWSSIAVIMPDHVHLICSFPEEAEMSKVVGNWKRWTSRFLKVDWQDRFFEHRLRSENEVAKKAGYILQNPVRAGLVSHWEKWPYNFLDDRLKARVWCD